MRRLGFWLFLAALGACLAAPMISATTWRTASPRAYYFQADRGTESAYVADTAGVVYTVTVRRKFISGDNGDGVRAYSSYLSVADTAGQGYDCTWLGGSRNLWYTPATLPWGLYNFYEIAGGADTAIAELQNIIVMGKVLPDSSVDASALEAGAVDDPTKLGSGVVTGSKLADRIEIPGSLYVLNPDSITTIRLLHVTEQLDTPDLRYFAGDSIDVSGVFLSMNQGATVRDTLTVARTYLDPGTIRLDDGQGAYLHVYNSGIGVDWNLDFADPRLFWLTLGSAAVQGYAKMYDGSSNYHTFKVPATATNYTVNLPATYTNGSYLRTTVSGSTVTLTPKRVWTGYYDWINGAVTEEYLNLGFGATRTATWPVFITAQYGAFPAKHLRAEVYGDSLAFLQSTAVGTEGRIYYMVVEPGY